MTHFRRIAAALILSLAAAAAFAADDITGFWQSIDDETGDTTTICYVYEYRGMMFGRIVVTYDEGVMKDFINRPGDRATLLAGDPYYAGLDFIYNMEDRGARWKRGNICDPKAGKIYDCELWLEDGNLIVRGKIGPFGRNQTWLPVAEADLPAGVDIGNPATWVPEIPELK